MGTNYYFHSQRRLPWRRPDVLHVGKQSGGWTFHFRAHRRRTDGLEIISLADWAQLFKTTKGVLMDEYDRVIEDPLKFLMELERPTKAQQESEDSEKRRGPWSPRPDPLTEWRDPEGFAFYDGEFC